ncbi:hypothetical protein [Actinomycetospora sp.]|uniref:hypothetical protein n=1 Tax=Actinomycetospora sp. TaxID=1872135 RepID=UPI002F41750C
MVRTEQPAKPAESGSPRPGPTASPAAGAAAKSDAPTESPRLVATETTEKPGRKAAAAAAGAAGAAGAAASAGMITEARPDTADQPERTGKGRENGAGPAGGTATATATAIGSSTVDEPTAAERTDAMVPVADPEAAPGDAEPRPGVARDRRRRRRVLFAFVLAALVLAAFLGLVALITGHDDSSAPPRAAPNPVLSVPAAAPAPRPVPQLPRGGTTIFPNYRVVAYYGTADTSRLGVLGTGTPQQAAARLEQAAAPFATPGRTVQPAMELIVGLADGGPGPDGDYHHDIDQGAAGRYLAAARADKQLMIIDVQPGRTDFMTAVRPWENLLREPDVGLALDPEWRMPPGEVPGKQIGTVAADEINEVSTWLANLVQANDLPQKLFVVHQFTPNMITNPERLQTPPQLAVVQHVDGFGAPPNKLGKYRELQRPTQMHLGFKLFYTQDTPMLTAAQALALQPAPDLVTYQ